MSMGRDVGRALGQIGQGMSRREEIGRQREFRAKRDALMHRRRQALDELRGKRSAEAATLGHERGIERTRLTDELATGRAKTLSESRAEEGRLSRGAAAQRAKDERAFRKEQADTAYGREQQTTGAKAANRRIQEGIEQKNRMELQELKNQKPFATRAAQMTRAQKVWADIVKAAPSNFLDINKPEDLAKMEAMFHATMQAPGGDAPGASGVENLVGPPSSDQVYDWDDTNRKLLLSQ